MPRLGGIALLLGIFVPALAFLELDGPYRGILLGAAIATTVGAIDDFRGLPWWGKLGGQIAAGAVAVGFGVTVDRFTFPGFGSQELPEWAAGAATIFWVVAIMNMVNFLDGMDGLAAGICAIAGSTFAIIGLSLGVPEAALLSAIVAGACFGFLHHNFYPARIFMGDSERSSSASCWRRSRSRGSSRRPRWRRSSCRSSCWRSRSSTRRSSSRSGSSTASRSTRPTGRTSTTGS